MPEIQLYEDKSGEHRWRYVADNGQIMADSGEGYSTEAGAREAAKRFQDYTPDADVLEIGHAAIEVYRDRKDEYRWRLRHRNGNILADSSEGYDNRSAVMDAVESLQANAPDADTVED